MELTVRMPGFPSRLNPRGLGLSFSHAQHRAGSEVTTAGWIDGWMERAKGFIQLGHEKAIEGVSQVESGLMTVHATLDPGQARE